MTMPRTLLPAEGGTGIGTGPVTVLEPQLLRLTAGRLDRLFRPIAAVSRRWRPGDRLWVREPFFLAAQYNGLSPTAAVRFGAVPLFAADLASPPDPDRFGPRRMARCLPRLWHRQHLVVTAVERRRIQAITQDEIAAQGFAHRAGFAATWDAQQGFGRGRQHVRTFWAHDPEVLVVHFEWLPEALPERRPLSPDQPQTGEPA